MKEYLDKALEEFKRVDHLLYVSLKYTRTVDVIKSVIHRLITTYDCIMDGLLNRLLEEKKIKEIPTAPAMKAEIIKKEFRDDEKIVDNLDFYLLLRRLAKCKNIGKREEYRRHVTMIAHLSNTHTVEVKIDDIKEYYLKAKDFLEYIQEELIK